MSNDGADLSGSPTKLVEKCLVAQVNLGKSPTEWDSFISYLGGGEYDSMYGPPLIICLALSITLMSAAYEPPPPPPPQPKNSVSASADASVSACT